MSTSSTANFSVKRMFRFLFKPFFFEAFALGVTEDRALKGVIVGYIQREGKTETILFKRAIITGGLYWPMI